jgi:phage FluMu protein Com
MTLRCVECGALSEDGRGWRARLADDPRDDEQAEVAVYCPRCDELEFGSC